MCNPASRGAAPGRGSAGWNTAYGAQGTLAATCADAWRALPEGIAAPAGSGGPCGSRDCLTHVLVSPRRRQRTRETSTAGQPLRPRLPSFPTAPAGSALRVPWSSGEAPSTHPAVAFPGRTDSRPCSSGLQVSSPADAPDRSGFSASSARSAGRPRTDSPAVSAAPPPLLSPEDVPLTWR